jgi:hypothetical protein
VLGGEDLSRFESGCVSNSGIGEVNTIICGIWPRFIYPELVVAMPRFGGLGARAGRHLKRWFGSRLVFMAVFSLDVRIN